MTGSTSPLFLLPLLLFSNVHCEPKPTDRPPVNGPFSLMLPTTVGRVPKTLPANFGSFPTALNKCGKQTVTDVELGTSFVQSQSFEIRVDCTPNPQVVIVDAGNVIKDKPGNDVQWAKCMGTQTCQRQAASLNNVFQGSTGGVSVPDANKGKRDSNAPDMCSSSAQASSLKFLFSNEEGCSSADYGVTQLDTGAQQQYVLPRWMGAKVNDNGTFDLEAPWSHHLDGIRPTPPLVFTNYFLNLPDLDLNFQSFKSCTGTCDRGSIVKLQMNPASWSAMLYVKGATDGFKICFDAEDFTDDGKIPVCKLRAEIHVLLKQGVVVWPRTGTGRASLIKLRPSGIVNNTYAIEIGYGVRRNRVMKGEFYVGNMHRERVISDTGGYSAAQASRVTMFFPDQFSLQAEGGISSKYIQSGKAFVTPPVAATLKDLPVLNRVFGVPIEVAGEKIEPPAEVVVEKIIGTTTPVPIQIGSNAAVAGLLSSDNANDAAYVAGKWWTWGMYIGFLIGTLTGVSIIGAIFYFLRRTVFGFWYRAMYKRYGCDVSGTTGGITGVGFGATTTGAMTVGKTTAGSNTTTGATSTSTGTTMSGTTTKGGSTSTSASTIGM